ncbi:MAG: hypothetical protein VCC36_03900 [Gammaproteobacteria bacterium]
MRVARPGDVSVTVGGETRGGFCEPEAAIDYDRVRLGKLCRQRFGIDERRSRVAPPEFFSVSR